MSDNSVTRTGDEANRDAELESVIADYIRACDGGASPDQRLILERHPELADDLRDFFANRDQMDRMARPFVESESHARFLTPPETIRYFGDYEVLEEIGRGGMGVIYKAKQVSLDRLVAIKMMMDGRLQSPQDVQRFRMEAESAASLDHPNIVPIYEVGEHDSRHYFSMKLVEGGSLGERIRNEPVPLRESARLIEVVARAVHYAHQRGILHRDLKPANILLEVAGGRIPPVAELVRVRTVGDPIRILTNSATSTLSPLITDFGLAKRVEQESELTQSGAVVGTPSYMAPEQAAGHCRSLTTATDVYGLGAILYALLTRRAPFIGETALTILTQVKDTEPQRPCELNPQVDRDLETICLKCLEKDPTRRYASAAALADDLGCFLRGEPIAARPISRPARLWRWCKRNPVVASLSATSVLLLVAVAIVTSVSNGLLRVEQAATKKNLNRAMNAERVATDRLGEVEKANQAVEASLQDVKRAEAERSRQLFDSLLNQARARRWSKRAGQRFESLAALTSAARLVPELQLDPAVTLELRNEAIAAMTLADVRVAGDWWDAPGKSVKFDSKLQRYACLDDKNNVRVYEVGGGQLTLLPNPTGSTEHRLWQFSPDDQLIALGCIFGGSRRLRIWDWARAELVLEVLDVSGAWPDFSPDGHELAVALKDRTIRLFDLTTRKETHRLTTNVLVEIVRWHPLARKLAIAGQLTAQVLDLDTGKVLSQFPHTHALFSHGTLNWHPQGRHLVTASANQIWIWNADVGNDKPSLILDGHKSRVTSVVFNHHGDLLASNGYDGTLRIWDPWTGQQLVNKPGGHDNLQFSSDDALLPHADGKRLCHLEVVQPIECRLFGGDLLPTGVDAGIAFSPDGRILAGTALDGVRLWDISTGHQIAQLGKERAYSLHFDPAFRFLVTSSAAGLSQWTISEDGDDAWQIGPRRIFHTAAGSFPGPRAAMTPDGRRIATRTQNGVAVLIDLDQPQKIVTLSTPHGNLWDIAISSNGQWLASGSWNGRLVRVWNAKTGAYLRDLPIEHSATVTFSPDSRWLVTGADQEFCFWNVETWERGRVIPQDPTVSLIGFTAFSPDGTLFAAGYSTRVVKLYDPTSGQEIATLEPPNCEMIRKLCFSPDGTMLAVGDEKQAVQVWDLRRLRSQLKAMSLDWNSASYPPTDTKMAARSLKFKVDESVLPSANITSPEMPPRAASSTKKVPGQISAVYAVAYSPDGKLVATGGGRFQQGAVGELRVWEAESGRLVFESNIEPESKTAQRVHCLAFNSAGTRLAAACESRIVRVWDVAERRKLLDLVSDVAWTPSSERSDEGVQATKGKSTAAHRAEAFAVVFSPDGKQIATGGSDGVRIWDAETGKELKTLNAGRRTNSLAWPKPLASASDAGSVGHGGTTLFACCHDFVSAWNIETGEELFHQAVDRTNGWRMALSPDGKQFAVGLKSGGIQLRSAEHGGLLFTLDEMSKENYDVAFSPDGSQLFVASNEKCVTIYDLKTRERVQRFDKFDWPVFSVALRPGSKQLATGWGTWTYDCPGGTTLFDVDSLKPFRTLGGPMPGTTSPPRQPLQQMVSSNSLDPKTATEFARRGRINYELDQIPAAIADCNKALELQPDNENAGHQLIWMLAMGPAELRDTAKALPLAERLAQRLPNDPAHVRSLGMVYYRLKRSSEAVDSIRRAIELRKTGPYLYDLFLLAMAYHQNHQPTEARTTYDQAMEKWRAIKSPEPVLLREVTALRSEIEGLLGIKNSDD